MKNMVADVGSRLRVWMSQQASKLRQLLPRAVTQKMEKVACLNSVICIRKIAKIALILSVSLWIWQVFSIAIEKSDQSTTADLAYYQGRMKSLEAEIKDKTGDISFALGCVESFFNGLTLGAFDKDGFGGPVKRDEEWRNSVRTRADEYQYGIDKANANLAVYREKVFIRNVASIIAIAAVLFLIVVPPKTNGVHK